MKDTIKQLSLFDEYMTDDESADIVDEYEGYRLVQAENSGGPEKYKYKVFDEDDLLIAQWPSDVNCLDMIYRDYEKSQTHSIFIKCVKQEKDLRSKPAKPVKSAQRSVTPKYSPRSYSNTSYSFGKNYQYDSYSDDDDEEWWGGYQPYSRGYSTYKWTPPARKTGYLDKLNKSDTLVIHRTDPTTTMLRQIYEGKGWDVLNDDYIDTEELHQLLQSHDRLVLLGHGTSYGLMGGNIGPQEAPYLKDKKLFVIWCNADAYFKSHNIGQGCFITGNMPSDSGEAAAVGCHVSRDYMDENITYWCKLCGDVCERALEGDANGAVQYVRDNYWERYGQGYDVNNVPKDAPDEVKITKYNYDRTKVQK